MADGAMKIDLDAVLRARLPRYYPLVPRPLISWLESVICQDQLNEMLRVNAGKTGAEFCRGVLDHLDVKAQLAPGSSLPDADPARLLYVSNHPLGGLDGMALISMITDHHGGREPWFLVNDLLMAIEPLHSVFLPVNKHGRQQRADVEAIDAALSSDRPVIIFPAGLVSRQGPDGEIADLQWRKKFIDLAVRYRRDVVPLHFGGRNRKRFYRMAKWRERSGLRFNIEMILLPGEVFASRGSRYTITVAPTVSWQELTAPGRSPRDEAARLRQTVYDLITCNA